MLAAGAFGPLIARPFAKEGHPSVRKSGEPGPVVTDGAGFTLHRFDRDAARPVGSDRQGDRPEPRKPTEFVDGSDAVRIGSGCGPAT
ncbi:hypothetical protein ACFFSH_17025 [Streptomyces filamentosus]|uniref:Uncharacterized protein n=1 Tax=Streptomyces filamentosus TaxID=67294 RepID=A0A919EQA2_STRFL|nr:hypothetical protein [Streptomyces filamentosus]GHG07324.1 hypothetical protein GCM10017667_43550 [Streptomyces filamentosus]